MGILHVNKDNFKEHVLKSKGVVLVDFYADWCGPCRTMTPIIEELASEFSEVKFIKINVDENPDLSSQYEIFSIPTILIFKDGEIVNQFIGATNKETLAQNLKKLFE